MTESSAAQATETTGDQGRLLRWIRGSRNVWGLDPGAYDPKTVAKTLVHIRRLFHSKGYFATSVKGWENVPPSPAMFISNHSGGTTVTDAWGFMVSWYDHFGVDRPIHGVAHEMILATDTTGSFFSRIGAVRGSRAVAYDVLHRWKRDLLVMPGGDLDAWRPHSERYRVRFGGRTGYARTAIRAQVPIVPLANAGAHETFRVLTDGRRIAKALHLHDLARSDIFPIHLSLPWGLTIGPWPHLPVPVKLRYRIGKAIAPPKWPVGEEPPKELVDEMDAQVRAAVQGLLDLLKADAAN